MKQLIILLLTVFSFQAFAVFPPIGNPANEKRVVIPTGGVDVGNPGKEKEEKNDTAIGDTGVTMLYPSDWRKNLINGVLTLDDKGVEIQGQQVIIKELSEPTPSDLQYFFNKFYPNRKYELHNVNNLKGIKTAYKTLDDNKTHIDMVLEAPNKNIVSVHLILAAAVNNKQALRVLETLELPIQGVAMENEPVEEVTLLHRIGYAKISNIDDETLYDKTLTNFSKTVPVRQGLVGVGFGNSYDQNLLEVGLSGGDTGRFVLLGRSSQINFANIKVQSGKLIVPRGPKNIDLSDIYRTFSADEPLKSRENVNLKPGQIYLLRLVSWPEQDQLIKIEVVNLIDMHSVTLRYQRLAQIPKAVLQKRVAELNHYTRTVEMQKDQGIVTLFSRNNWGDFVSATFNFLYGTRDNVDITRNSWNLIYEGREDQNYFDAISAGEDIGTISDLGVYDLNQVSLDDFKSMTEQKTNNIRAQNILGHTYLIYSDIKYSKVWGAFKVLQTDPQNRWVRIQWRRIMYEMKNGRMR